MSVYIPGMEMPTSCRKCGLMMNCDDCEGWECYCLPLKKSIGHLEKFRDEPYVLTDKRRDDCPLLYVPEHGDLIDRDKLEKDIERYVGGEESRSRFHHWVQVQRSVILKSEEEQT